jgi:rRNA-processing protein FCF1
MIDLNVPSFTAKTAVIFDTNFMLIPEKFKIDIFEEVNRIVNERNIEVMVFDKTIYELQKIASERSRDAISAKVGLGLINTKKIYVISSNDEHYVDDLLVNAKDYLPGVSKVYVATQDQELKRRLKEKDIKIIAMAAKKRLIIG